MRVIQTSDPEFREAFDRLRARKPEGGREIEGTVRSILARVRREGDPAVLAYTERFDGVRLRPSQLEIPRSALRRALRLLPPDEIRSLKRAAARILRFHRGHLPTSWKRRDGGIEVGSVVRPLDRVGIYVPGGKAAYPSTVLMNALPARAAGVREIIMTTPAPRGALSPHVLAAAALAGVHRVFRVGGAQAVAALAYGTERIPKVDKIVGPGNVYVATAKRLVYAEVGVDLIAGPSEILVVADASVPPRFVAADLLSQAEHDEQAVTCLLTPHEGVAAQVKGELLDQLEDLPRKEIAETSLKNRGLLVVTKNLDEAIDLANLFAPEHLELAIRSAARVVDRIRCAGTILVGAFTPNAVADYIAGPNHVLPTGGSARFFSPLGVEDFLKRSNVVLFSRRSLRKLGPDVMRLAEIEGLVGHARSVDVRMEG